MELKNLNQFAESALLLIDHKGNNPLIRAFFAFSTSLQSHDILEGQEHK